MFPLSESLIEKTRASLEQEDTAELRRRGRKLWNQLRYRANSRSAEHTAEAIDRELARRGTHVWAGYKRR
jgi:hypothetical protein